MQDLLKKSWLITGGCGFIGTSLVAKILKEQPDSHIRILDNLTVGKRSDLSDVCTFFEIQKDQSIANENGVFLITGDILDYETCLKFSKDIDCIVHLAASTGVGPSVDNPRIDMESNVLGTFNMLESARINNVNHFVFASSGAPLGIVQPPLHEEVAPHPVSPYGASKLAGEGYCSSYYHSFDVNTVCLRFGNVYGPRSKNKSSVVAKFIKQALKGQVCEIYGDGSQTRDFIYIADLLEAIMKASRFNKGGEVFQIATGKELTLDELVQQLKNVLKKELSKNMIIKKTNVRLGDTVRNYSDVNKAKTVLGWSANIPLAEGLRKTVLDLCQFK